MRTSAGGGGMDRACSHAGGGGGARSGTVGVTGYGAMFALPKALVSAVTIAA